MHCIDQNLRVLFQNPNYVRISEYTRRINVSLIIIQNFKGKIDLA